MGSHSLLQRIFPTQGSSPVSCIIGWFFVVVVLPRIDCKFLLCWQTHPGNSPPSVCVYSLLVLLSLLCCFLWLPYFLLKYSLRAKWLAHSKHSVTINFLLWLQILLLQPGPALPVAEWAEEAPETLYPLLSCFFWEMPSSCWQIPRETAAQGHHFILATIKVGKSESSCPF